MSYHQVISLVSEKLTSRSDNVGQIEWPKGTFCDSFSSLRSGWSAIECNLVICSVSTWADFSTVMRVRNIEKWKKTNRIERTRIRNENGLKSFMTQFHLHVVVFSFETRSDRWCWKKIIFTDFDVGSKWNFIYLQSGTEENCMKNRLEHIQTHTSTFVYSCYERNVWRPFSHDFWLNGTKLA